LLLQFDVTFPALPCSLVAVDTMDVSGEQHYDIVCALIFASFLFYALFYIFEIVSQALLHKLFPDGINIHFAET
jgi:hypothetical protein